MLDSFGVPRDAARSGAGGASTSWTRSAATAWRRSSAARGIPADAVERLLAASAIALASDLDASSANQRRLERASGVVAGHADGTPAVANLRRDRGARRRDERGRASASRSEPGARPVVLHRRDHGDRRAGPRRQPRRRRPLRRADRHVLGREIPGVRVLARPRADPRRDGRARHVPGERAGGGGRRAGHALRRGGA